MLFFVNEGRLTAPATADDAALKQHDGKPVFDIVDVSTPGAGPGWTLNADGSASPPVEPTADLAALKIDLKTRVDATAETLRLTLITPGSGQAMEYQEAYAEAARVAAALATDGKATFDLADYPMLAASIGYDLDPATDTPSTDVPGEARAVMVAYQAYQKAGAMIRAARLKGKAEIDSARDAVEARKAFDAIRWPSFS